jgi:peptidoglycan/xylan/chitin deacetylase (PgdA/CDA1 family)
MRSLARSAVGLAAASFRRHYHTSRHTLTSFLFHEVCDDPAEFQSAFGLAVSTSLFRQQVDWIQSNYSVIHPSDLLGERPLPTNAAIITFDDGFLGAVSRGIEILASKRITALMFLNMKSVLHRTPLASAIATYLSTSNAFLAFAKRNGIRPPFHLSLTPRLLDLFIGSGAPVDTDRIRTFQGEIADTGALRAAAGTGAVVFGNHLYEHWNAAALSLDEFHEQFALNARELATLPSSVPFFSFPNGHPSACFTMQHVEHLRSLGVARVFAAVGAVSRNTRDILLARVSLGPDDRTANLLSFRVMRESLRYNGGLAAEAT